MKKIKVMMGIASIIVLSGCSTVTPKVEEKVDTEPRLVGIPLNERIALSEKKVMEQRDIWYRYKMGIGTKEYNVVAHNTDVDARKGSSRTIPQAYAKSKNLVRTDDGEITKEIPKMETELKNLQWVNNSANGLGREISKVLGYTFVTNKQTDINVTVVGKDISLEKVIKSLEQELGSRATVLIMTENQTFNIIYK